MTRVRRSMVVLAAGAVMGIVAPGSPAHAGGPEVALGNICEHVSTGSWTASELNCFTGSDRHVPAAAFAVCEHALGMFLGVFTVGTPGGPDMFGWECILA